jgi:DNA-binding NtrC family response regulator
MNSSPIENPKVLIADDQVDVLEALRLLLKGEGFQMHTVSSPAKAIAALEQDTFDLLLMDMNYARDTTSGKEGLDLLSRIRAMDDSLPVVVMTAWANVDLAVAAMRQGARDFVQKPWDNERLMATIRTQVELSRALRRGRRLEAENELLRRAEGVTLIAESPAMAPVMEMIRRIGPSDANVLITGENGTGKGVVARAVHAVSVRADKPLITVNMGSISESVFESEMFGHVKGAFTDAKTDRTGRFELADGGTLFLDEIANIPLSQQTKLLRVIETGEFEKVGSSRTCHASVRLISATNANLSEEIAGERFRQDLLFRLNTVEVNLPPLRRRREDIPLLADHFLQTHTKRYRKKISKIDASAMELLLNYAWPGNVRELGHVLERAVLMARTERITASDCGLNPKPAPADNLEEMSLEEVERYLIKRTLSRSDGNVKKASEALGLSRSAFYRRLEKYGL